MGVECWVEVVCYGFLYWCIGVDVLELVLVVVGD